MRPSASTAARTSPPAARIRMPPPKRSPRPASSSTPKRAGMKPSRNRKQLRKAKLLPDRRQHRSGRSCRAYELAPPAWFEADARRRRRNPLRSGNYCEMGGAGGPAGATGGGADAAIARGGSVFGDDCCAGGSGVAPVTDADTPAGTASGRDSAVSGFVASLGLSILALSDLPESLTGLALSALPPSALARSGLPSDLAVSDLAVSDLAVSDLAASDLAASSLPASFATSPVGVSFWPGSVLAASSLALSILAASVFGGSSCNGLLRLPSFCFAEPRSLEACAGAWPSGVGSPGRTERLALRPCRPPSEIPSASGFEDAGSDSSLASCGGVVRSLRPNRSSCSGAPPGLVSGFSPLPDFGWSATCRVSAAPFDTRKPASSEAISGLVV